MGSNFPKSAGFAYSEWEDKCKQREKDWDEHLIDYKVEAVFNKLEPYLDRIIELFEANLLMLNDKSPDPVPVPPIPEKRKGVNFFDQINDEFDLLNF